MPQIMLAQFAKASLCKKKSIFFSSDFESVFA